MRLIFYLGCIVLAIFEVLHVYFIMPMPGSQEMNSVDAAYFLHTWRWTVRLLCVAMMAAGIKPAFNVRRKWIPVFMVAVSLAIVWLFNFKMVADKMFMQPSQLILEDQDKNKLPGDRLVIGVANGGEAKAYPVSFLAYHHQVLDSVGGKMVMVTYCSVCRTGRVYEPYVQGRYEKFRLVGMDHFNAMFEDETTKSWWRQVSGVAVTGKLKGEKLPEVYSEQMTIDKWFAMYPHGLVMQPDPAFTAEYDSLARFEKGKSKGSLTRTDSISWNRKSWVIGIEFKNKSKAYDWIYLRQVNIINDQVDGIPIVIALSDDGNSFNAFQRPSSANMIMRNDTLFSDSTSYSFSGKSFSSTQNLKPVSAYQEFWHSWKEFHPETERYPK